MDETKTLTAALPRGVWRRAACDWAYRVEIEGYGSVTGLGFASREEAREAMKDARLDLLARGAQERVELQGRHA